MYRTYALDMQVREEPPYGDSGTLNKVAYGLLFTRLRHSILRVTIVSGPSCPDPDTHELYADMNG